MIIKPSIKTSHGIVLLTACLVLALVFITQSTKQLDTLDQLSVSTRSQVASVSGADSGLVAWWKFDEGSGTTAGDSAGSNTGTLNGGPTWVTGQTGGNALSFDGINDLVSTGSDFIGTGADTYSAWIYRTGTGGSGIGHFVSNGRFIGYTNSTTIAFSSNGGTNTASAVSAALTNNRWVHIVITRNASGATTFYFNGVQTGTANQDSGTPVNGTTNVTIGNNSGANRTWGGLLDDVRIYNRALSAQEVGQLYNLGR